MEWAGKNVLVGGEALPKGLEGSAWISRIEFGKVVR
jgi:hypothetical protein